MTNIKLSLEPSTDERSPLRHFTGVLEDYIAIEETSTGGKAYTIVHFNFAEVEAIESVEPYNFLTGIIDVFYSERAASDFDILKKSIVKLIDPSRDIDLLIGKKQTWQMVEAMTNQPDPQSGSAWFLQPKMCWVVTKLSGYASESTDTGPSLENMLIELVNGKNDADFYQAFYEATDLRDKDGYEEIAEAIANKDYLTALKESGQVMDDADGVWSKVE